MRPYFGNVWNIAKIVIFSIYVPILYMYIYSSKVQSTKITLVVLVKFKENPPFFTKSKTISIIKDLKKCCKR